MKLIDENELNMTSNYTFVKIAVVSNNLRKSKSESAII